jgi:hypothetical protein
MIDQKNLFKHFIRHEFMSEIFGFDLPDKSKELTDKEYVNLVNRIRGNFLSYVRITTSKIFKMEDIMNVINDPWILEHLKKLETLTRKIQEK